MSPSRALRMCTRCLATATHGKYCERHAALAAQEDKARKAAVLYNPNSKAWRQTRAETLYRYPQCAQLDTDGNRCPQLATEAHHKVKATDYVALGGDYLDQDNLVGLCRACHTRHTIAERIGATVPGSFAPPDNEPSLCI
jgi:hypothetical protein